MSNEGWIHQYEQNGVAIQDILAGSVFVDWFSESSQLEVIIDLTYTFFDDERENWTCHKHSYCCMEKNFTKNLYNELRLL